MQRFRIEPLNRQNIAAGDIVKYNLICVDISSEYRRAVDDCKTISVLKGSEDAVWQVLDYFIANNLSSYDKERLEYPKRWKTESPLTLHAFWHVESYVIVAEIKQSKAPKSAKAEEGRTHDVYWNAAQFELVFTHKMSSYLRMYWAKKVIKWSPDYECTYAFLIEQNDEYELDGRDPNGYCGVMWNFGMHDRAHANRLVFEKIHWLCADGIRRKFRNYIDKYVSINYERAGRTLELNQ